jgi:hypothetical protein
VHSASEPRMARFSAPRMALSVSHGAPNVGKDSTSKAAALGNV